MASNYGPLFAVYTAEGFQLDFAAAPPPGEWEKSLYENYRRDPWTALLSLGFTDADPTWSPSLAFLAAAARIFLERLARTAEIEYTRENTVVSATPEDVRAILARTPFGLGAENISADWIGLVFTRLSQAFAREITAYPGTVAAYLQENNPGITVFGRVFFHLVENPADGDYPFAFLATYSTGRLQDRKAAHTPLKHALLEYQGQHDLLLKLLSAVTSVAQESDLISQLVESGELFSPLKFTSDEAYTFLKETPLYEERGVLCRIPDWWKKKGASLRLALKIGDKRPPLLGTDALFEFDPELYLGEDSVSEEELRALLAETAGLAFIKGKWVELNPERLRATLAAYDKAKELARSGAYTMAEAMRLQLQVSARQETEDEGVVTEVTQGRWLQSVVARLAQPALIEDVAPGSGFKAVLREYQQQGLNWLKLMKDMGFGACLADDMGLGKTVQVIALLEYMRRTAPGRTLLVIPASLMGNWQKELDRFAPRLRYRALYSSKEDFDPAAAWDLVITTYGLVARLECLRSLDWDLVILDEAQAIKNPAAKQTKAVKGLKGKTRIALTGTPIENRLGDLWSLFDFLNSGLLGTAKEFKETADRLGKGEGYAPLRRAVSPFILRRLKTDKAVISDLPDKVELKAYTGLSKKQVALYNKLVQELAQKLETAAGMERRGLVLASLMKAKQVCNHPDQFLGQGDFAPKDSSKFERLQEICQTIAEKRERALVFTQFREMVEPLSACLERVFQREGLVLHGQTPVKKRFQLVERFCGEEYVPFMVLSLKAGGVGLNLAAANHVIHFDRWWNPAVENQATDRAFRIGQKKNVLVHKFITRGTIEEKIDQMLEEKSKLAADILAGAGETWLTEYSNEQLLNLFTLSEGGRTQ